MKRKALLAGTLTIMLAGCNTVAHKPERPVDDLLVQCIRNEQAITDLATEYGMVREAVKQQIKGSGDGCDVLRVLCLHNQEASDNETPLAPLAGNMETKLCEILISTE